MIIEQIIYDYLRTVLDVPVYTQKPAQRPPEYVLIERTSGGVSDFITTANVAAQSYAGSLARAAQLNEDVKAALQNIAELPQISRAGIVTDGNYTDTTQKNYRYQTIVQLTYY